MLHLLMTKIMNAWQNTTGIKALTDIKGITENKKSVAFLILMQDTSKTLVDSEADSSVSKIVELLEKQFGATLRN